MKTQKAVRVITYDDAVSMLLGLLGLAGVLDVNGNYAVARDEDGNIQVFESDLKPNPVEFPKWTERDIADQEYVEIEILNEPDAPVEQVEQVKK